MDIPLLIFSLMFGGVVVGMVQWVGRDQHGASRENILKQHEYIDTFRFPLSIIYCKSCGELSHLVIF